MKRIVIAGLLALAATGQAFAADLPPAAAPPPRAPATYVPTTTPLYNWGGIYLGINGGYGFGTSDFTYNAGTPGSHPGSSGDFSTDGFMFGGTLGANFQMSQFVLGIEGDGDWQDIKGNSPCAISPTVTCYTKSDWLATVRGRAGWAFNRVLVFGTGGGAFGAIQSAANPGTYDNSTKAGWTAGGGFEFAFLDNWTAKIEYLYVDLQNGACSTTCVAGGALAGPAAVKFTESLIRGGINFKFGP